LALIVVILSVGEVTIPAVRWIACGVGLLLVFLLVTGWGRPLGRERELLKRARRAEAERDEIERYFVSLMDSVPSNIYFKNLESKFLRVNQSMAQLFKVGHPQDLIGKSDRDFFGAAHAEQALQDEQKIIETGKGIESYVERETFADGSEGWVLSAKLPFRDSRGNIVGTLGISSDVSQMVRTSQTLERERNTLRSLIDSIPDNIYIRDSSGSYLVVNQALATFLGYDDPEEVIGKKPSDFFIDDTAGRFLQDDLEVINTGTPVVNRKNQLRNARGEKRNLLISKIPVRDEEGKIFGIVGMNRDITEELRAQRKLKQTERQMQEIMENSPAPIYVKSLSGRYLLINRRFLELFDLTSEEIIGKDDFEVMDDEESAKRARILDAEVAQTGEPHQTDQQLMIRNKMHTYVSSKFPMLNSRGDIYAIGAISIDISERKEAEEAIKKINGDLVEANDNLTQAHEQLTMAAKMESVGRLAAGVAHEVKNPLAMIGMGLELLSRRLPEDDKKAAETVARMRRGIHRAKKIVKGLVDYSSDRALDIRPMAPSLVVRESLELVEYELNKANIEVVSLVGVNLPDALVDQTRIEQVMVNLFINAMHAMDGPGTLTISARLVSREGVAFDAGSRERERPREGESMLQLLVQDTGSGIPTDSLNKVFDPFFTTKETGKGTGLGLAVSHKIAELHGGKLTLRNREDGIGAEAELLLKVAPQCD